MHEPSAQRDALLQQYKDSSRLSARAYLHVHFSTNPNGWMHWLFDHLALPPQSHILELGTGPAWFWSSNIARVPPVWQVTLTDFSAGMINEAQQRLQQAPHPFKFAVVDAQAISYDDNEFDGVIANNMLYHVPDRPRALAEIRRVLKPDGRFYASTLDATYLHEMEELFPISDLDIGHRLAFNLENGTEQLNPFFSNIIVHRYENTFVVPEAEPIVNYLFSLSRVRGKGNHDKREHMLKRVQDYIDAHGAVHLTGNAGLFEAW